MNDKKFIPGKSYIPVSGAVITEGDKQLLHKIVDDGWYTEGQWCKHFSQKLQKITEKDYVQLVNSGSSASLVAMKAATKLSSSTKPLVLTCATAFPTTVSPIYDCGKIPLYVDINPFNLEPEYGQIEKAVEEFGDFICGAIFTHTMGFPFNESYIRSILPKHAFLISDCCDAIGSFHENEGKVPVGGYSDLSTYSFFPAHHITAGQGGAVATNNDELDELARCYSSWGRSCYCNPGQTNTCGKRFDWDERGELPKGWDHKYIFSEHGYNLRMTEFQGALGYSQSIRLSENMKLRIKNYGMLYPALEQLGFGLVPLKTGTNPFGFPIIIPRYADYSLNSFVSYLETKRIRTRRLFAGNIVRQPAFMDEDCVKPKTLSGSDYVMNQMLWIGCHETLTLEMIDYVIDTIRGFKNE